MKEIKDDLGIISRNAKALAQAELDLVKLQAINETSQVASFIFSRFLFVVMSVVAYAILIASAGIYLNELLGSHWQGLVIAALSSVFLTIILYLFRKVLLEHPIQDFVIKNLAKRLSL